jgi:hypothetical protein
MVLLLFIDYCSLMARRREPAFCCILTLQKFHKRRVVPPHAWLSRVARFHALVEGVVMYNFMPRTQVPSGLLL